MNPETPAIGRGARAALAGGCLIAVLALGLDNHRSADRTAGRIGKQLFALAGCLVSAIVTWMLAVVGFGR